MSREREENMMALLNMIPVIIVGVAGCCVLVFMGAAIIQSLCKLLAKLLGENHPHIRWLEEHGETYLMVGWVVLFVISLFIAAILFAIWVENDIRKGREQRFGYSQPHETLPGIGIGIANNNESWQPDCHAGSTVLPVFLTLTNERTTMMEFEELAKRLRAVRQRIQEKGYPMPKNIHVPDTGIEILDDYDTEIALKKYEEYEKRMDESASTGGQSQPAPTSSQATFNRADQKSDYTDMYTLMGDKSHLDHIINGLRDLKLSAEFLKLDDAGIGYLKQLAAYDPKQWKGRLAQKEKFINGMTDLFFQRLEGLGEWVDMGYKAMEKPGVNVDPAYRKAFEQKAREAKQFISTVAKKSIADSTPTSKPTSSSNQSKPPLGLEMSSQSESKYPNDTNSGYTEMRIIIGGIIERAVQKLKKFCSEIMKR